MGKYKEVIFRGLLLTFVIIHQCVGPPTKTKEPGQNKHDNSSSTESNSGSIDALGLEYNRYLKEVVEALESEPEFRKKLELAQEVDFRSGKVAAELEYVNHNIRTKLDELKRTELQRLKQLVQESDRMEKRQKGIRSHENLVGHIDHSNEHTFEVADLHKLITKVRMDLEEVDKKRRQEFKEYEMEKQFEQEQKMKTMDEEHKKKYQEELEAQKKKHQKHEPIHHPGSKAQLEEVWEKEDHMGNQKFNPRTFFHLHDLDGNGYWDEEEVKALFLKELQKMYDAGAPEDDMKDREEDMERMREHVFAESDTNRDRLISYSEFLEQTKKQEFDRDEGWETIDQRPQYSQQEYEQFERRRREEIERLSLGLNEIDPALLQYAPNQYGIHPGQYQQVHPGQAGYVQPPHPGMPYQYHASDKTGQLHPNQMPQQYQQHPNQPPHPAQVPQYHHAVPPPNMHPNQVPNQPNHPQQVQYQNQVPVQHPNQGVHPNQVPPQPNQVPPHPNQISQQQQFKASAPNSNEAPKQAMNQMPQMANNDQQQQFHSQPIQQAPSQINQIPQQQFNQPINAHDNNIPSGHPQPPQYHPQQSNNVPPQGQQHQSKYEPHGNRVASNDKTQQDNLPK